MVKYKFFKSFKFSVKFPKLHVGHCKKLICMENQTTELQSELPTEEEVNGVSDISSGKGLLKRSLAEDVQGDLDETDRAGEPKKLKVDQDSEVCILHTVDSKTKVEVIFCRPLTEHQNLLYCLTVSRPS